MDDEKDIISIAKKLYDRDKSAWSEIYSKAREDLNFLSDEPGCQWDDGEYQERLRTGCPAYQIDQLGQFIHQVENDIRQNTPSINIIPAGNGSDQQTAEIFKGLIKNIEYKSKADSAYDNGASYGIRCSIGFIRVDHDYCDEEGFEQDLIIKRVTNPLACLIDSDTTEADGSDAMHGFVLDKITVSSFKNLYPGKEVSCFESEDVYSLRDDQYVTIAEFFRIEESDVEYGQNEDGSSEEALEGKEYKNRRKRKKRRVMRYKLSGEDVLEKTTFPGKYVPLVPVYGEEIWIDGKRNLFSLIRKSKQAQMMYNLWKSLETESLMKQTFAPVQAVEGTTEDYAQDYIDPRKAAVLRYKLRDINGDLAPAPNRLNPPTIPTGFINAARETVDDIKATMGLYNASLGNRSNETSGVAIAQRKQEGDVATFHFADNLNRAIAQVGRILVCAIPEIYDTARIIRIIGSDDEPKEVGINGEAVDGQEQTYNLTKGKYDVRVISGPSYTTQRQEQFAALNELIKGSPELLTTFGDIYFKSADFSGAEALADRIKKVMNPALLDEEGQQVDPQVIQLQQALQEAQAQMAAMQQELQSKQGELQIKAQSDAMKAKSDQDKNTLEAQKLQLEAEAKAQENRIKEAELALKERELELKFYEIRSKQQIERDRLEAESARDMAQLMQPAQIGNPDTSAGSAVST